MTTVADVVAKLRADSSGFNAGMDKAAAKGEQAAKKINDSWSRSTKQMRTNTERDIQAIGKSLDTLKNLTLGKLGVDSIGGVAKMVDQFNSLEARIRNATAATGDFKSVNEELFKISQRNGTAFGDTVSVFQGLARTSKELGASNADVLKLTDTVQKLGTIGGSSSEQMKNGMLQFTQAMAGGVVHAEEFNSILENMPEVANRIADGLGMTVGQLRMAVKDGKVLSKDVFDALMKQAPQVAKEFEKFPVSMERAGEAAKNSFGKLVVELDKTFGVSTSVASSLKGISGTVDEITAAVSRWANEQRNVGGYITTNAAVWKASWQQVADAINGAIDAKDGFGAIGSLASVFDGGKYVDRLAANEEADYKQKLAAEMDRRAKLWADKKKGTGGGSGDPQADPEKLAKYVAALERSSKVEELKNQHLERQAAITKAIEEAEAKTGGHLNDQQKALVTAAATRKFNADQAAKTAQAEEANAKTVAETLKAYDRQNKILELKAKNREDEVPLLEAQWKLEDQIGKLNDKQLTALREKVAQQDKLNKALEAQKILEDLKNERSGINNKITANGDKYAEARLDFEQKIKNLSPDDQAAARLAFGQNEAAQKRLELMNANREAAEKATKAHEEAVNNANELLEKDSLELDNLKRKLAGQEDLNDLKAKELQITKNPSLSDEEKQKYINALREQWQQQKQVNDLLEQQKGILDRIQNSQDGYIAKSQRLKAAFDAGWINVNQYNDAMKKLVENGKKASDFATSFANTLTKGLEDAVFSGKKLSDVFKDMGKQLAQLAAKKLVFDPASKAIAFGADWLTNKAKNAFGFGPSYSPGPLNNGGSGAGLANGLIQGINTSNTVMGGGGLPPGATRGADGGIYWSGNGMGPVGSWANPIPAGYRPPAIDPATGRKAEPGDIVPMDATDYEAQRAQGLDPGPMTDAMRQALSADPVSGMAADIAAIRRILEGTAGAVAGGFGGGAGLGPVYAGNQLASGWNSGSAGGGGFNPTYSDKARALAQIEEQRAQQAQDQGLWLQASLHRQNMLGGSNAWNAWSSMNPGFGATPQIANGANDFMGFLSREPGLANILDPRFSNWAAQASGGIARNSYSSLGGGSGAWGDTGSGSEDAFSAPGYVKKGSIFAAYNGGNMMTQGDWNAISGDHTLMGGDAFGAVARIYGGGGGNGFNSGLPYGKGAPGTFFGQDSPLNATAPLGFANGGRPPVNELVNVGEAGKEAVLFDRPGTVIPNTKLKALAGGGNQLNVQVINNTGQPSYTEQVDTPNGKMARVVVGKQAAADIAGRGPLAKMLESVYGLKPKGAMA